MWIFSKYGFFSIVKDEQSEMFKVRSRVRKDLENLQEHIQDIQGLSIHEHLKADYHYRLFIDNQQLGTLMKVLFESITYPNFKDQILQLGDQEDKLDSYHEIWEVMWNYQNRPKN
jgi:hypothetical protein